MLKCWAWLVVCGLLCCGGFGAGNKLLAQESSLKDRVVGYYREYLEFIKSDDYRRSKAEMNQKLEEIRAKKEPAQPGVCDPQELAGKLSAGADVIMNAGKKQEEECEARLLAKYGFANMEALAEAEEAIGEDPDLKELEEKLMEAMVEANFPNLQP
jgi:hypothetical protein